jgi:hypothetical protein
MAFEIEKTQKTPEIFFDSDKGVFRIHGAIFPENSAKFFDPLFNYAKEYLKSPNSETTLELFIIYFNTSSSKQVYEFIKLFDSARNDTKVTINWLFDEDDEDMEETGEEYNNFFSDLPFNLIPQE